MVVIACYVLMSCQRANKVEIIYEGASSVEGIIKAELSKDQRSDTLFLDYRFGMSEFEFNQHTRNLL